MTKQELEMISDMHLIQMRHQEYITQMQQQIKELQQAVINLEMTKQDLRVH